jgi:hypothetical protein
MRTSLSHALSAACIGTTLVLVSLHLSLEIFDGVVMNTKIYRMKQY